jgi:two-component sensor histidine kinase
MFCAKGDLALISERPASGPNAPEWGSAADELVYRLRQQQLAADYALFALKSHQVQDLLQEATRVCALGLQSDMCKIMEYLPAEHQFVVRAGIGWKPGIVGHARTGADPDSPTGYAFMTGEPVISNHLDSESRFRTPDLLIEHGVKRAINTLIQSGGERFGVLEVDSPVEGRFTEADLIFVTGLANLLGVALERQRMEEALKHKEALLQQALEHQGVLTREISHRVKNSLSIAAGLLNMQSRASPDPGLKQALSDAHARVQAIAMVHDRLWRKDDVHAVELSEFLGELCEHLRASAPNHDLVYDIAPVAVSPDQAVSIGLLVNELITNALKYAYPAGSGEVRLSLAPTRSNEIRLEICDHGVGLPAEFGSGTSAGLGRKVVSTLSRQLRGRAEWRDAAPGTRFVLVFKP